MRIKKSKKNFKLYQRAHQGILQRAKDARQFSNDKVCEESLEDVGDGDEDGSF